MATDEENRRRYSTSAGCLVLLTAGTIGAVTGGLIGGFTAPPPSDFNFVPVGRMIVGAIIGFVIGFIVGAAILDAGPRRSP